MATTTIKDLYAVLGVSETATADELKKQYRKLAKQYHPDATGGDKAKEAKFKELSSAYDVLSDEKKRKDYDRLRKNPMPEGWAGGQGAGGEVDLEELLRQMNMGGGGAGMGGGGRGGPTPFGDLFSMFGQEQQRGPRRGQDLEAELEIELPDAALGAERTITIDRHQLTVKIPAGIRAGQTIRLAGKGRPGRGKGAPHGDLLLLIRERPHPLFRRKETAAQPSGDIEVDAPVPLHVALGGGNVDVTTLEGTTVSFTFPARTSSGKRLRLKEKGATYQGKRGDLYAVLSIQMPAEVTEEQQGLMQQLAESLRKK